MDVGQISASKYLRPLKISLPSIPHITIETNQTCNFHCKTCYNIYQDTIKSLDEIKNEIDLALTKRNLETITLIGGEPTLHPDLPEIIRYIRSKKLICQLLTNGIVFRKEPSLIKEYKLAGLDRILLHVDSGQPYPENEIDKIIDDTFRHFQEHKIYFALSLTVYNDNPGKIPMIMRSYAGYSFFDGVLATIERRIPFVILPSYTGDAKDYMYSEYQEINTTLNITPTTYLPSNNSDDEISWLIYFYYINSITGFCMEASGKINHVFRKIYKFLRGKEFFAVTVPAGLYYLNIIVSVSFELFFNPMKIRKIIKLVSTSRGLSKLRYQYIVVQDGPYFDNNRNALRICYHCPDATIRNGKITPVCVADLINPLKKDIILNEEQRQIYRQVYHHLEQL